VKNSEIDQYPNQLVVDLLRLIGYVISKIFWLIRYNGRENIPDKTFGSFLIASNHQTYIDPVWICLPMRRRVRYMAVKKAFEWPFVGKLIKYLGAFPVSMDGIGAVRAMKISIASIRDGCILTVFPEGAREFADGQMLPFKTGAVMIAKEAGVPILPVTVSGGNRIWPQKQKYPKLFRRVEITYHPLLYLTEDKNFDQKENISRWTAKLAEIIAS